MNIQTLAAAATMAISAVLSTTAPTSAFTLQEMINKARGQPAHGGNIGGVCTKQVCAQTGIVGRGCSTILGKKFECIPVRGCKVLKTVRC